MDEIVPRGGIVAVQYLLGVFPFFLDMPLWTHFPMPSPKAFPAGAVAVDDDRKK
jgi:hypothetical protein